MKNLLGRVFRNPSLRGAFFCDAAIRRRGNQAMRQPTVKQPPYLSNFGYLLLLTAFFILIELAFFLLCNNSYLYAFSFVANRMQLPMSILSGILFFAFVQLLIHFCYTLIICLLATALIKIWRISPQHHLIFSIGVWLAGILTILLANSYYFSNSHFTQLITILSGFNVLGYFLAVSLFCWAVVVTLVTVKWCGMRLSLLSIIAVFLLSSWHQTTPQFISSASVERPNIIIIGVDSLRPDILDFFSGEAQTPFITQLLNKSTVFSEAITPLARTYPSWVGILSGLYPRQTGVRTNLSGTGALDLGATLPSILRKQGYETLYATDETRFSNIEPQFGFDRVITPPVGLNDFLLGSFNDFPMSNLLVNTAIGKWLFPYSYANRAAFATYNPNSFLKLMGPALSRDHHQPLFLAVHFCLPHQPYVYDRMRSEQLSGQERYVQSVQRVDQQLRDFFAALQQAHLLDHAVVVLLSDHGEALELKGDRVTERSAYLPIHHVVPAYYPITEDKLEIDQSAGHGTDVLGLPQYHSLLAFRLYGVGEQAAAVIPGVVSLLDIKPTLLGLVSREGGDPSQTYTSRQKISGISLVSLIKGQAKRTPSNRMLFLESDFSPEAVRSVYPNISKVILEGVDLFQVDPTTAHISVKKQTVDMIIKSKQYAVIYNDWMLALYPQSDQTRISVLINLQSGNWTSDLNSAYAQTSPVKAMQIALREFYGNEVGEH